MSIIVNVINQKMIAPCLRDIIAGSQKFVKFRFNLDSNWNNLVIFAQFIQNGVAHNQYLDNENCVYLPPEIEAGTCTLMLYGSNNQTIGTTNYLTFKVGENKLISDANSTELSASLYNQLINKFKSLETQVDDFVNNENIIESINDAVSNEISQYLEDGTLANLTIEDASISREKLNKDINMALNCIGKVASNKKNAVASMMIDDISPITHNLSIQVESQNIVDFQQITSVGYSTPTLVDNGFIIEGSYYCRIPNIPVLPNTDYYVSFKTENLIGNDKNVNVIGTALIKTITNGTGATFNSGNNTSISLNFYSSVSTESKKVKFTDIQLELGTEPTEYKPYVDISDITVRRYSKNLLNFNAITSDGYAEPTIIENGFRLVGGYYAGIKNIHVLPNTKYYLSYTTDNISGTTKNVAVFANNNTSSKITSFTNGTGGVFDSGNNYMIMIAFYASGSNESQTVEFTDIQLELGTQKTEYQLYVPVEEATVLSDGTVSGLTSVYPKTVIIGGENVTLECEYNTDLSEMLSRGAESVNYNNTISGLDSTNVKDAIDELAAEMNRIIKVESWKNVQDLVRLGLAQKVFKIGDQLYCNKGNMQLIWDIIGFDHDVPVDSNFTHSMTIQLHDCYTPAQFDAREALYYAAEDLPAGTYNFSIVSQPWCAADNGKTFQFTLANDLAAGGQIVLEMTFNQALAGKSVKVYENSTSTTAIETCTISEGTGGTALGKTDGSVESLNHIQRAIMGSNRWSHSAIKQWLNSNKAANGWWTAKNNFDRPSSQVTSAGFLTDMDSEFLAVIGEVNKRTALNTVTDGGGYEDSKELMFLLSRSELYGGLENSVNEGEPYPYYANYSDLSAPDTAVDSNRIKYRNGSAQYWWQRSCNSGTGVASAVRTVSPTGSIGNNYAYNSFGVAPACNII